MRRLYVLIFFLSIFTELVSATSKEGLNNIPSFAFIVRADYGIDGTNATMFARKTIEGSAICIYNPLQVEKVSTLFETKTGFILDMSLSFDAKKILFSYKETNNSPFHIWEINTDGTGLKQLTKGYYHDVSPIYLPGGKILFTSSRGESYSLCQNYLAFTLHVADKNGEDIERIDFSTICSISPSLMNDGRVMMARWEYQDKNIFCWQGLWTVRPDGRNLSLHHGNTFIIPNSVYGAKEIPGTDKIIATMAAHHYPPIGDIAIIERKKGIESNESITKLTHATPYKITKGSGWKSSGLKREWAPGDRYYKWSYCNPFPFNSDYSLVSFGDELKEKYEIRLLNHTNGEVETIFEHQDKSCFSPIPLQTRAIPHQFPEVYVPSDSKTGTFHVSNVYEGLQKQGVAKGEVSHLRIMEVLPKTTHVQGPRLHDEYPIMSMGTYYAKYNHGTVPVDKDGSAYFEAPADKELYFIALNKKGKEIQRMGSITQIRPGEMVSCVGCHDDKLKAPDNSRTRMPAGKPDKIAPPEWGAGPVDYVSQVQPVLDKHCIKCHSGIETKGGIDLSGDKTRFFNMSYLSLCNPKHTEYYFLNTAPTGVFPAKETGSYVSGLTKLIESNHGELEMSDVDKRAIYAWIDSNVPYYSTFDVTRPRYVGGRDVLEGGEVPGAETILKYIKKYIHNKKGEGWYLSEVGREYTTFGEEKINFTNPDQSRFLHENLSISAGGLAPKRKAIFKSKNDRKYKELLGAIKQVSNHLNNNPRMDMPGAVSAPKKNLWGYTF